MTDGLGLLPEHIGPFRVLRAIARGGMAEVFEVEDPSSGEHLALKWLKHKSRIPMLRFNREYEVMNTLNHPNILRVYGYGLHDGLPWMTMELVDGTPVQVYCRDSGFPGTEVRTANVIKVAYGLATALDHIHTRGLVHRDLKSANLLVVEDGRIKLLDFGAARFAEAPEPITRDGEFLGTFAYASPEQLRGKGIDHRSDLYSYGVLLYRMCTGKRPFYADDPHALAKLHVYEAPPPPSSIVVGLPERLEALILRLLAKDPDDRPASGAELAAELQDIASEPLAEPPALAVGGTARRLVGREDERAALRYFVHAMEPGSMAVFTGEIGSGLTALRESLQQELADDAWRLLEADFGGVPDADAVFDLVGGLGKDGEATGRALQATLSRAPVSEWIAAGENVAELLHERVRRGRPAVILLHDLQAAKDEAFAFLGSLRETLRENHTRVVLVGDYRVSLEQPLSRLDAFTELMRVPLPPLDERQVALLVGALLKRRPPPTAIARRIHAASGGHPAFVEQVVRSLLAQGHLAIGGEHGVRLEWARGAADIDIPVPREARRRIEREIGRLPADTRRVLEAVAMIRSGSVSLLATVLERTSDDLEPALAALQERGWLDRDGEGFRCQRMLARICEKTLPPIRAVALTRALAGVVDQLPAGPVRVRVLAESDRRDDAVAMALTLAHQALESDEPDEALAALAPIEGYLDSPRREDRNDLAAAAILKANALLLARPADKEAGRSLVKARQLGREAGTVFDTRLALARSRVQRVSGHYRNYQKYLAAAEEVCDAADQPGLGALIASRIGEASWLTGDLAGAGRWHERAVDRAQKSETTRTLAYAATGSARMSLARGDLEEAERIGLDVLGIALQTHDHRGLARAVPIVTDALGWRGRYSDAAAVLDDALPILRVCEVSTYYFRAVIAAAWLEVRIGRLGRAQERVDELAATIRRGEHLHLRLESGIVGGRILVDSGEHAAAARMADDLLRRAEEPGLMLSAQRIRALRGAARWLMGEHDSARRDLDQAVSELGTIGDVPALAEAVCYRAHCLGDEVDADKLFYPVEGWLEASPLLRLRHRVAAARRAVAAGKGESEIQAATDLLDELTAALGSSEAAAMRVHPVARQLRVLRTRCSGDPRPSKPARRR